MKSKLQDHKNKLIEDVIQNSYDLLAEARLLQLNGYIKIAFFLMLTSIEEIESAKIILNNDHFLFKKWEIAHHEKLKFSIQHSEGSLIF